MRMVRPAIANDRMNRRSRQARCSGARGSVLDDHSPADKTAKVAVVVGVTCIATILLLRRYAPALPGVFIVSVVTAGAHYPRNGAPRRGHARTAHR